MCYHMPTLLRDLRKKYLLCMDPITLKTHISSLRSTLERLILCGLSTENRQRYYQIWRYKYLPVPISNNIKRNIIYNTFISAFDDDQFTVSSTLYMSCTFLFCLVIRNFACEGYSKFRKNLNQTIVLPVLKL